MTATPAPVWTPCSACWAIRKRPTPATHKSQRYPGHFWCDEHAVSSDPPLGEVSTDGAVDATRERVWPGLDEPQGLNDE